MKARSKQSVTLSIGMIVKNEERCLERCLQSMVPLMKALPCELIIADTGSADNTWSIAKKYADTLFHWEWNGDFAAARNATLERATGMWYFFIDADEWFLEWKPLAQFLTSGESALYQTGNMRMLNYLDAESKETQLGEITRLYRRMPSTRFEGRIHEGIKLQLPEKTLTALVGHDGYFYATPEQERQKKERNRIPLLEELQKDPNNLRLLTLTADVAEPEDARVHLYHALELVKDNPQEPYYGAIYSRLARVLGALKKPEELLALCTDYAPKDGISRFADMDIPFYWADALYAQEQYAEAIPHYEKYLSEYQSYQQQETLYFDSVFGSMLGTSPKLYDVALNRLSHCYFLSGKYLEALECLRKVDLSWKAADSIQELTNNILLLSQNEGRYDWAAEYHDRLASLSAPEKQAAMTAAFAHFYTVVLAPEERPPFVSAMASCASEDDLIRVMRLLNSETEPSFPVLLKGELVCFCPEAALHCELLLLALWYQLDITPIAAKISREQGKVICSLLTVAHPDYPQAVLQYSVDLTGTLRSLQLSVLLLEYAVASSEPLPLEQRELLLEQYIGQGIRLLHTCYRPEVLSEENRGILPPEQEALLFLWEAMESENPLQALPRLKRALELYPAYQTAVQLLRDKLGTGKPTEAELLQRQFKEKIQQMLEGNFIREAAEALKAYQKLYPADPEVPLLLSACEEPLPPSEP